MFILSRMICRFNVIAIKTLQLFLIEIEKMFFKFPQKETEKVLNSQAIRNTKNKCGRQYSIVKTVWHETVAQNREPRK